MKKIKIIIVDDHKMFRDGLKASFKDHPNYEIIGEASDGWEFLDLLKSKQPDIVLMDINMPGIDGIEAAKMAKKVMPKIRILLLTMHDSKEFFLDAFNQGVYGYILKMASIEKLFSAIDKIAEGNVYYDPDIVKSLPPVKEEKANEERAELLRQKLNLSPREIEIAYLMAAGYKSMEIAEKLFISQRTVFNHRYRIFDKLGIKSTAELVRILYSEKSI